MGVINKTYELVQAVTYLFNMFCNDMFDQSEADPRVFRTLDDREVKIVVVAGMDDILAHAQAIMERFANELGEKVNAKSMVEKFGVEKASRTPAHRNCQPSLKADEPQTPGEEEDR